MTIFRKIVSLFNVLLNTKLDLCITHNTVCVKYPICRFYPNNNNNNGRKKKKKNRALTIRCRFGFDMRKRLLDKAKRWRTSQYQVVRQIQVIIAGQFEFIFACLFLGHLLRPGRHLQIARDTFPTEHNLKFLLNEWINKRSD